MSKMFLVPLLCSAAWGACFFFTGCTRSAASSTQIAQEILDKYRPDESGAVMVVMYHRFSSKEPNTALNRRPETFRKDLETFYRRGYYPVNALEFAENRMNVPAGKTPIVLTFDDSLPHQFKVVPKGGGVHIDPDCAVGILETFHKHHPDWPMKGTFFVLPREGRNGHPFGQAEYVNDKLNYLHTKGYEIANHTATHTSLAKMNAQKVQWELATAVRDINRIDPKITLQTLALPFGAQPRSAEAKKALLAGESGGTSYANRAVFLASWRPSLPPLTKKDKRYSYGGKMALFDKTSLERITPDARHPGEPGTLEYWLKYFETHPRERYISDGDPHIAAIPRNRAAAVNTSRAAQDGIKIQYYETPTAANVLSVD